MFKAIQNIKYGQSDSRQQLVLDESDLTWRVLGTLNAFRIFVALILIALFFASDTPRFIGDRYPTIFAATAVAYFVLSVVSRFTIRGRWITPELQILTQVPIDISAVVILMHASGGIESGLGGLLIVFVGAGSLIMPRKIPAFFAAIATLAVLGEQLFSQIGGFSHSGNFTAAGMLGAIIFAIALAARPLARRIQVSEALARQRGVDLANSAELNEYIVQQLRESIVVLDADDRVRLINTSAAKLLDAHPTCHGMNIREASGNLAEYISNWRKSAETDTHIDLTVNPSGDSSRIKAHLAPLGKGDHRNGPILVFLEDSSLINARVQQSKLASLGRLSASIAHEIRNPVGAMSHAGQLLAESKDLNDDNLRLTEIITKHAERVSHIIDNVLQLSRRESSQPERFDLEQWLKDFAEEFSHTLELPEGKLLVTAPEPKLEIRMDPSHLRQVMWNLCDNAVKYANTPDSALVELSTGRTNRTGQPYLEILDHGQGIDETIADKIFEPFFTERSGETGLGLYISRELCELNRAALVYRTSDAGGSIFQVIFADPDRWEDIKD